MNTTDNARADAMRIFNAYPQAVPMIREAVVNGFINGHSYFPDGPEPCGCVLGWVWRVTGEWPVGIGRDLGLDDLGLETFIFDVKPGDVPATSIELALLLTWIDAWQSELTPDEVAEQRAEAAVRS